MLSYFNHTVIHTELNADWKRATHRSNASRLIFDVVVVYCLLAKCMHTENISTLKFRKQNYYIPPEQCKFPSKTQHWQIQLHLRV